MFDSVFSYVVSVLGPTLVLGGLGSFVLWISCIRLSRAVGRMVVAPVSFFGPDAVPGDCRLTRIEKCGLLAIYKKHLSQSFILAIVSVIIGVVLSFLLVLFVVLGRDDASTVSALLGGGGCLADLLAAKGAISLYKEVVAQQGKLLFSD